MVTVMERLADWTQSITSSHRAQLITTAVASGAIVATSILGYQAARYQARKNRLKHSISASGTAASEHDSVADQIEDYRRKYLEKWVASKHDQPNGMPLAPAVQQPEAVPEDPEEKRIKQLAERAQKGDYDKELILEQLARNRVFLTDAGLQKLRSSFVIVVGLGGVGSHAAAALARSGVTRLRLIDFDQVTLSSLNRHAVATLADVGTPKVHCIRRRLEQITPWVNFDCRNELFQKETARKQLGTWRDGQEPDYVLDAIDNIDTKVELIKYCHTNKIPIISSMGAGCKSDPTRVHIGDISVSTEDPLSRSVRRRLRLKGVKTGIPVIFSTEKTGPGKAQLMPLPDDEFKKGKVNELGVLPDFRVRILPVLGTMPAVFGLCAANHIMLELTGYPHDYLLGKARDKMYDGILAFLQGSEERLARAAGEDAIGLRIPVSQDDVGYLIEEVYRGRSVLSGLPTRLVLIRWGQKDGKPASVDHQHDGQKYSRLALNDLVCMTREEAARHEQDILKEGRAPSEIYDERTIEMVHRRMKEEAQYEKYR